MTSPPAATVRLEKLIHGPRFGRLTGKHFTLLREEAACGSRQTPSQVRAAERLAANALRPSPTAARIRGHASIPHDRVLAL